MDIFTTQLKRFVQIPVKKQELKVKALDKDARTGKLKEDHDHVENHDYYFKRKKEKEENELDEKQLPKDLSNQELDEENKLAKDAAQKSDAENKDDDEDDQNHFDIFV